MRGAFVTGLVKEYPKADLRGLAESVRAGEVKTVLCFREDLNDLGFEPKDFKAANIIYCGALENSTSQIAKICVPMRGEFEKYGMWINRQFRIQRFEKAVEAPKDTISDISFLLTVLRDVSKQSFAMPSISEVRKRMCAEIPALKGCENVGDEGKLIDASAFADIDFPESDAMHYTKKNPQTEASARESETK